MKRIFTVLLAPTLLASAYAQAADKQWKPTNAAKAERRLKNDRRVASVPVYSNRNEYRSSRSAGQKEGLEFRIGIAAGAGMQSQSSSTSGTLDVGTAPTVGISADIKNWKYVGIEEDAYFQLTGSTPPVGGSQDSSQGLGSFTTLKGQYAFSLGDVKITPKGGVGFAYQRRTDKSASLASTVDASMTAMGVFGMIGIDLEPFRNFTLTADYARSVTADVEFKSGTVEQTAANPKFDRIRIGGFYQFIPGLHGGVQYIQRGIEFSQPSLTPGASATGTVLLRQIQAVFQYDL